MSSPGLSSSDAATSVLGIRQSRQQRGGGCDDDPGLAGGEAVQGTGPRRRHVEVRQQASVGIDFRRRQREDTAVERRAAQPFEAAEEEARVADERLDVLVGRHDDDGRRVLRRCRHGQRLRAPA